MFKVEFRFKSGRVVYRTLNQTDLEVVFSSDVWEDVLQQYTFSAEDAQPLIFSPSQIEYIEAIVVND